MTPRPHWLANGLCLAIVAALVWLNTLSEFGWHWEVLSKGQKSFGWPYSFFLLLPDYRNDRVILATPFILNAIVWIALFVLPPVTLNGLLRRTLQIRLVTAFVLMLTASLFLWLGVDAVKRMSFDDTRSDAYLLRVFVIRILIGLTVMSAVVWIAEKVLRREEG